MCCPAFEEETRGRMDSESETLIEDEGRIISVPGRELGDAGDREERPF
jgi:hypothetical protein